MKISTIKKEVLKDFQGKDIFGSNFWNLIEKRIPSDCWVFLKDRSGAFQFDKVLPEIFSSDILAKDRAAQECWDMIGYYYRKRGQPHQALQIYFSLYYELIETQELNQKWIQKATPLLWIAECCSILGYSSLAKRYLILAHIDDSIALKGDISPEGTGVYFRMVWGKGLSDKEFKKYAEEAFQKYQEDNEKGLYPEWILQNLDENWMTEIPSPAESGIYWANSLYMKYLIAKFGDKSGRALEILAQYMLSCMPGCRTTKRMRTVSSEIDIVCSIIGIETDFRSELGRYFICECKDWKRSVNFTNIAKFCRVLDSVKSRFGILFSTRNISGKKGTRYASNEIKKLYQDRGIILVVVDLDDMNYVIEGANFINLLRNKYEKVRLDMSI